MICQPEKMAQGGRAIARIEGKITFITGALPGETVEIEYLRHKKDFDEARVVRVLEAHAERVEPRCAHYGKCGGCNLQHASISLQRTLKSQVVTDLFARMAKIKLETPVTIHGGDPWQYRRRARLVLGRKGWGFREDSGHEVEPIKKCPVLCEALQQDLSRLPTLQRDSEIQCFAGTDGVVGRWNKDDARTAVPVQRVTLAGLDYAADARVFFQSNFELASLLLERVQADLLAHRGQGIFAVDLFSGVGVFAKLMLGQFEKVVAVEWNPGCLAHARHNLEGRAEFISSDAEAYLLNQKTAAIDYLVVDPPRTGLSAETRKALLQSKPKRIAYVSCDPVTLARDVGEFVRNGWTLQLLEGYDFYPQTDHLEMLAVLV